MEKEKKAVVIKSTGHSYIIKNSEGKIIECKLKGSFKIKGIKNTNPIAVGDYVQYFVPENYDIGLITKIEKRKNYIIRKSTKLSKQTHIIASNIDNLFVVASLNQPKTSTGFIDRLLVTAEAYKISAVIVFNKFDLIKNNQQEIDNLLWLKKTYEDVGYQCVVTSVKENINIDKLKKFMKSKTIVFSGHSGVGKSALINSLDKSINIRVGEISEVHEKGKHTTTFSEMHSLGFGANIIDTPGIREFGLIDISKEDLSHFFPEIFKKQSNCKFNNCTHTHEPKCGVIEAVENGEIALSRYENYINIFSGL